MVGEVAEEGVRLMADQKEDFSKAFDITVSLVTESWKRIWLSWALLEPLARFSDCLAPWSVSFSH